MKTVSIILWSNDDLSKGFHSFTITDYSPFLLDRQVYYPPLLGSHGFQDHTAPLAAHPLAQAPGQIF